MPRWGRVLGGGEEVSIRVGKGLIEGGLWTGLRGGQGWGLRGGVFFINASLCYRNPSLGHMFWTGALGLIDGCFGFPSKKGGNLTSFSPGLEWISGSLRKGGILRLAQNQILNQKNL